MIDKLLWCMDTYDCVYIFLGLHIVKRYFSYFQNNQECDISHF